MLYAAITIAGIITGYAYACTACSHLHSVLPPWEFLDDFPTVQKYYKAFIYFIGYVAANYRSSAYKSISTQNGTVIAPVVVKKLNGGNGK